MAYFSQKPLLSPWNIVITYFIIGCAHAQSSMACFYELCFCAFVSTAPLESQNKSY